MDRKEKKKNKNNNRQKTIQVDDETKMSNYLVIARFCYKYLEINSFSYLVETKLKVSFKGDNIICCFK